MKRITLILPTAALALIIAGCRTAHTPMAHESAQLQSQSQDMKKDGEGLIQQGLALQNQAQSLRVAAAENRKQADLLEARGETDHATHLRLDANDQETDATQQEYRGRDLELRGRDLLQRSDSYVKRSTEIKNTEKNVN